MLKFGGDTSGLQKALNKVNGMTSSLTKELKGVNSLLKFDPKNTTLLENKQEALAKKIETTSEKLNELRKIQELTDEKIATGTNISQENYRALQEEIIRTEQKLNSLKAEASKWNKVGDSLVEFGNKVTNVSNKIDGLGTTLTTRLTLPIVAIGTTFINSAKEFETAFTGVIKTVDATEEQLKSLKQGIKDMAEEVPSSTTEIAAVAEAAGQLGIQTDNILNFTKAMIDLGNSTNLTAEEAASQLAKFANITNMSQKNFDKLGSSIVDLGNNFATTEADIVNMAMRLAGAGAQVGLTEGEILGLATALSSVGIEAEMGGSAISKAMVKMENAVELGGNKLQKVLKQTGMSLQNLELMSANDSKGFRELSQSIGITSTELKQLITAGTNLEDFAKVSGKTAEEFKKDWKDNAADALSSFIQGLSKAEEKGDSAIAMLSEMGLTEVRLRDSLLRAANAENLFNSAIETGTKSFEENVALTNEANKRYETLESRIKTTGNKFKNLATNMGDKLTPTANKLLDKVDDLIDKFDDLSEEEIENIIKTGALVASIGPAIKILGTFGKTTGTTITTLGNFSKAIANVKNGVKTAEGQIGTFTKVLTLLTNPTTLAVGGIVALTTAFALYAKKQSDEIKSLNGIRKSLDEQSKSWEELKKAREQSLSDSSGEINQLEYLRNELSKITDENGKVKEGYKDRANFILNQLNSALGTEYKLNDDLIGQYEELKNNLDKVIQTKKAEATLSAYEGEYQEALKGQAKATENLVNLRKQLNQAQAETIAGNGKEKAEAALKVTELGRAIQEETNLISQYGYTLQNYEELQKATINGTSEEIQSALDKISVSWEKVSESAELSTSKQIENQQNYNNILFSAWQEALSKNDEYQASILKNQLDTNQKQLDSLYDTLSKETALIKELTPEQIAAYQNLANTNYEKYSEYVNKLSPDMQKELEKVTGVIINNTSVETATGEMSEGAERLFQTNMFQAVDDTSEILNKIRQTVQDDTTVEAETGKLGQDASAEFTNNANSWQIGNNFSRGLVEGINAGSGDVYNAVRNLGNQMKSQMVASLDEHSPSKATEEMGINFDLGLINGILDSKREVLREVENLGNSMLNGFMDFSDFEKINKNLSNNVIEKMNPKIYNINMPIHTTDKLTTNELDSIFNYMNRKFGLAL